MHKNYLCFRLKRKKIPSPAVGSGQPPQSKFPLEINDVLVMTCFVMYIGKGFHQGTTRVIIFQSAFS